MPITKADMINSIYNNLVQHGNPQPWGEGSMDNRKLIDTAIHSGGVIATAR